MTVDLVNHPPHYKGGRFESIDIIEAFNMGFHLGNAWKYVCRYQKKGGRQDLEKALWYLKRLQEPRAWALQVELWNEPGEWTDEVGDIVADFGLEDCHIQNAARGILYSGQRRGIARDHILTAQENLEAALKEMNP